MGGTVDQATLNQIRNIEQSSGHTLDEWVVLIRERGGKHTELVGWLKSEYGLGHGNANVLVHKALESAAVFKDHGADPAAAWFTGKKADLRPIYDAVAAVARSFGDDIEFAPKNTYMSLRRRKQFACINPATAARVDVGLNLKDVAAQGRLIVEKPGGMFSHRVPLTDASEVDAEFVGWLRQAYEQS